MQSLVDEGRITEAEAELHPHKNMILKALDGFQELEPDLFVLEVVPGDRLLLCSDGASGVLGAPRLADILGTGSVDYAAVELVRASLAAGSNDNVTCVVADVRGAEEEQDPEAASYGGVPLIVGAAAEQRRRPVRGAKTGSLFRGHRAGDTGELEVLEPEPAAGGAPPASAIRNDPVDPEDLRYAPREPRRFGWARALLVAVVVVGLAWIALAWGWTLNQRQFYVGESAGNVTIYRGTDVSLLGVSLSHPYETSNVPVDELGSYDAASVREGRTARDLTAARRIVDNLADTVRPGETTEDGDGTTEAGTTDPTSTASPSTAPTQAPTDTTTGTATQTATTAPTAAQTSPAGVS